MPRYERDLEVKSPCRVKAWNVGEGGESGSKMNPEFLEGTTGRRGVRILRQGALEEKESLGLVLESRCMNLCDIHEERLLGGTDVC